ncbi:DnaJ-like subfamily C member 16 [Hondaea fermentalgiana]|uniref:DnaJ-like subfamily C member 16 n=1 Tax=Hondaea fermentalgiana TaxID=2315210 RepID=A0A2R5GF19_9STRA|nr:DnaJ-like subfamily C member 16 [Hondaea fermentalgiana]|eukprot:GBG28328.1 DnaJ-like subfamily C member 16 [Hondaea fermentalgiana]
MESTSSESDRDSSTEDGGEMSVSESTRQDLNQGDAQTHDDTTTMTAASHREQHEEGRQDDSEYSKTSQEQPHNKHYVEDGSGGYREGTSSGSAQSSTSSTSEGSLPEEEAPANGLTSLAALTAADLAARREANKRARVRAAERKRERERLEEELSRKKRVKMTSRTGPGKRTRPKPKPKPRKTIHLVQENSDSSTASTATQAFGMDPHAGFCGGPSCLSPSKSVGSQSTMCSPRYSSLPGSTRAAADARHHAFDYDSPMARERSGSHCQQHQHQHQHLPQCPCYVEPSEGIELDQDVVESSEEKCTCGYSDQPGSTRKREKYRRWLAEIKSFNSKLEQAWQREAAEEQDRLFREAQVRMAAEIEAERLRKDQLRKQDEANTGAQRRAWLLKCGWDETILCLEDLDLMPDVSSSDPLACLGLGATASDNDIRRRFKKLALMFHPDKNQLSAANEAFCAFSAAYRTLVTSAKTRSSATCGSTGKPTSAAAMREHGLSRSGVRRECFPSPHAARPGSANGGVASAGTSKDRSESFASYFSSSSSSEAYTASPP